MKRLAFLIAIVAGCLPASLPAEEPAQAFLDALRENGYYDVAIDYLADLEKSNLITDEFKSVLPFEMAETLIGSTSMMRGDLEKIEARLDEAQKLLTDYASKNQSLEISARTLRYQGNLLYRRATNIYLKQAESDRLTASEKGELQAKAHTMLQQSLTSYREAKEQIRRLIDPNSPDAIKIDPEDPSTGRKRSQFQTTYTQVRVALPMVTEQLADTFPDGDSQQRKYLQDAATEYKDVYDDYHRFIAGLKACVFAARCNQKLGKHQEALDLLGEIFDLGDNSALQPLKLEAYVLATQSWDKIEPYPHNEVVKRLEQPVSVLNRVEVRDPDWIRVQLELAIAKHAKAKEIKDQGGPKSSGDSKAMDRAAARVLRNVARVPSPYRDKAKDLLSSWNVPLAEVADADEAPPESFVDARQKAKDLIDELEVTLSEAARLRSELDAASSAAKKAELKPQVDDLEEQVGTQTQMTLDLLELALELADEATIRADINNVRYLQSFCYFASQQYFESALIGEFLLSKYPTVEGTRQTSGLMIRSYSTLMDQADDADKDFERTRLVDACSSVLDRWPGSAEAGLAASTMTRLALNEKRFDDAEKYFLQVPVDASYRPALGTRLGQLMWFDFKAKLRSAEATDDTLKTQLANAKKYLSDGVDAGSIDDLNYETALGALLLVDAHLESGEIDEAISRLETEKIAPLDLVKQKHPAVTNTSMADLYSRETYKTAIKAYLAAMKGGDDEQKWIDKASGIITAMRQEVETSDDPADRARVTTIYRLIAKELRDKFEAISDLQEKKKFATSLASFLDSIEKESSDAKTILWAGSTLLGVAESLSQQGLESSAQPLFQQAVSALSRAEAIGFNGEEMESELVIELKRQRALAQRGSGKYEVATDQFAEILKTKNNALNIQIDACETLQMWARATQRQRGFAEAIKGAKPFKDPKTNRSKNLIWGWEKIALATRSNEKFRDTYYLALYHVIECRMEYGVLAENPKAIDSALREIENERKRDPGFNGSAEWKGKFESLETRIKAAKQSS